MPYRRRFGFFFARRPAAPGASSESTGAAVGADAATAGRRTSPVE